MFTILFNGGVGEMRLTDPENTSESGIGIPNLKKRLELLYPNAHEFSAETKANMFHTKLMIVL